MSTGRPTYELTGFAVPEELDALHTLLGAVADENPQVPAADLMLFETAVIEIAGNVVEHGRDHGALPRWSFTLTVSADELRATLHDDGRAFTGSTQTDLPEDPFAESGRGLALARAALDELDYQRVGAENRWAMARRLDRP